MTVPDSFGFQIDIHHADAGDRQPTNSLNYSLQSGNNMTANPINASKMVVQLNVALTVRTRQGHC